MRKYFSTITLLVCLFASLILTSCDLVSPPIQLEDTDHKIWTWDTQHYDFVVVNYWASWCHECLKEIPNLNQFYSAHQKDKILFLSVNMEELSENELKSLKQKLKIDFPVLKENPNTLLGVVDPQWIPTFYIFSPQGKRLKVMYKKQDLSSLNRIIQSLK